MTLSHVTDFPNDRWALRFRFLSQISKKDQQSRSKSGDPMMLASMANRFIGGSFLKQLQNHASNHQGPLGLSRPSDPLRKKWLLFGAAEQRTGFPMVWFASLNVKSASRNKVKPWGVYWLQIAPLTQDCVRAPKNNLARPKNCTFWASFTLRNRYFWLKKCKTFQAAAVVRNFFLLSLNILAKQYY